MRVELTSVRYWDANEIKRTYGEAFKNLDIEIKMCKDMYDMDNAFIEIPNMESVFQIYKVAGKLVIKKARNEGFDFGLEIYDGWRE